MSIVLVLVFFFFFICFFFFFQAEDGIRDTSVTGVQTCALPILADLFSQVKKDTGLKLKNGDLIARNELKAFNSELSKKRAENVGIKKAIWRNSQDERVRGNPGGIYPNANQDHWTLEGKEYVVGVGLKDPRSGEMIEPGEPINCRCVAEFIVEFD